MPDGTAQIETPVILLVFNRPELTREVFARVAQVRPRRLLVVSDGPRSTHSADHALCEEVRRIATAVHWPCQLSTHFAQENMGCRARVISGLNWAFQQVDEAIILEDDILPDLSFFPYCEEMLARFRGNRRVSMISGFNPCADVAQTRCSYTFSALTHIWGWATWRDAWLRYDEHLTGWPELRRSDHLRAAFPERSARRYWKTILDRMHEGRGPNTWDYQWMYTNLKHGSLSVVPRLNLVRNLGFAPEATHTRDPKAAPAVSVGTLRFPLEHPPEVRASREMDALDQQLSGWHRPGLPMRAGCKLLKALLPQSRRAAA